MTRIRWPAERFYWAVIDGVDLRRPGVLPPGLAAIAADDIPVDIDTLHAIGAATQVGRILVCAAERTALEGLGPDVVSLTPAAAPPSIGADAAELELLVGRFEPRSVRARRTRRHASRAATVLACCVLIAIGLSRRAESDRGVAHAASDARAELLSEAGIPAGELKRRVGEARALEASRASAPRDVTADLASLLRLWPDTSDASVESVSFSDGRVLASVSLDSDPGAFLADFTLPPGWRLQEPRLNSSRGLTRMSLELREEAKE